jgi:hypothetical protein
LHRKPSFNFRKMSKFIRMDLRLQRPIVFFEKSSVELKMPGEIEEREKILLKIKFHNSGHQQPKIIFPDSPFALAGSKSLVERKPESGVEGRILNSFKL